MQPLGQGRYRKGFKMVSRKWNPLRTVTQRLASTPPSQLHQIAPALAETLRACSEDDLASHSAKPGRDDSTSTVLAHKFKTQLSSLLQDKTRGARWAAVVLIKATLEKGGRPVLESSSPWARGILGLLAKPAEPAATKRVAILTLTRIFVLTQGQPSLARELATPLLPGFVTACLNSVTVPGSAAARPRLDAASPLLRTVLQAVVTLLPQHPAAFRPFVGKLRLALAPLLAPTPSHVPDRKLQDAPGESPPVSITALAQRLFCLLPICAPRNASSEEWSKSLSTVVSHLHETADCGFRAVKGDAAGRPNRSSQAQSYEGTLSCVIDDDLGLPGWRGIYAGAERLIGLMHLVQAHIATTGPSELSVPLGSIFAALNRVLSIFEPTKSRGLEVDMINPEVSRDEREGLWSCLPMIHVAAIDTIWTVMERVGITAMSFGADVLEQLVWVFERGHDASALRIAIYRVVDQLLKLLGPSMPRAQISALGGIMHKACSDVLPLDAQGNLEISTKGVNGSTASNVDSYLKPSNQRQDDTERRVGNCPAARELLATALSKLPPENTPKSMRRELDRTAILAQHHEPLLASVLNPPQGSQSTPAPSLVPFLALAEPESLGAEAMLRPRMPFLRTKGAYDTSMNGESDQIALQAENGGQTMEFDSTFPAIAEVPSASNDQGFESPWDAVSHSQQPSVIADPLGGTSMRVDELTSPKRKRVNSPGASNPPDDIPEKRQRTTPDEQPQEDLLSKHAVSIVARDSDVDPTPVSASATFVPQAIERTDTVDRPDLDEGDSSGSEIPQINLDLSTDEEEESGDENMDDAKP